MHLLVWHDYKESFSSKIVRLQLVVDRMNAGPAALIDIQLIHFGYAVTMGQVFVPREAAISTESGGNPPV